MHTRSPGSVSDGILGVANACNQWGLQWVEPISGASQWDHGFSAAFRRLFGATLALCWFVLYWAFRRLFGGFSAAFRRHIFAMVWADLLTPRGSFPASFSASFSAPHIGGGRDSVWYENALELCRYRFDLELAMLFVWVYADWLRLHMLCMLNSIVV